MLESERTAKDVLPTSRPLELITQANDAIFTRDATTVCKVICDLCLERDLPSAFVKEQAAACLARAVLLLGDILPFESRFPPVEQFVKELPPDEPVVVAVLSKDLERNELLHTGSNQGRFDGIETFPVTYCKSVGVTSNASSLPRVLHAEFVMLIETTRLDEQDTKKSMVHFQDAVSGPSSGVLRRQARSSTGRSYFAKQIHVQSNAVFVAVVCFPKSLRDAHDPPTLKLLNRLSSLCRV